MTQDAGLSVADLSWSSNRLSGSVELGQVAYPFFFDASQPICHEVDPVLPITLIPAMKAGTPSVRLPPGLSPRLLAAAEQIVDIFHVWDQDFARTAIQADARAPGMSAGGRVGCFFSGGVDSFYSVLKHDEEITDLIFCLGMDMRLDGDQARLGRSDSMVGEVAGALDKDLVRVRTDIRSFSDNYVSGWFFHGALLAAAGLLFQHRFRKVIIPASHTYAALFPWGSHPLVDPLWSTEQTEFVHDGCEATRVEKVRMISSSDVAMDWLRVCWEDPKSPYNCGRCEKCLRTMINLRMAGALERCRTLPDTVDLRAVSRLRISGESTRSFVSENLVAVEQAGDDPALARALSRALKGGRRLDPQRWLGSARARAGHRLRRGLWARAPGLTARLKRMRDRRRPG